MKIGLVVALEQEFELNRKNQNFPICYTGIGKINATSATLDFITKQKIDFVVNLGTCGAVNRTNIGIHEITSAIEADFLSMPLEERGKVPFDSCPSILSNERIGLRCATSDRFVTEIDPWFIEKGVNVVDMELFAIAKICWKLKLPWRSFKFVTDFVNSDSPSDWSSNCKIANVAFNQLIEQDEIFKNCIEEKYEL